jgi:hypothetical protein
MYNNKKIILEIVNKCEYNYQNKDYIVDSLHELAKMNTSVKIYNTTKQNSNQTQETIIVVKLNIPTQYNSQRIYDVPVLIYVPKNFPYQPPEAYIERASMNVIINTNNKDVDPSSFRIIANCLINWSSYYTLVNVVSVINASFNSNFPVFNNSNTNVNNSNTHNTNTNTNINIKKTSNINIQENVINSMDSLWITNQDQDTLSNYSCSTSSTGERISGGSTSSKEEINNNFLNYNNILNVNKINSSGEEQLREILIKEIFNKIVKKTVEEVKFIKLEKDRLSNYLNYISSYNNKLKSLIDNKDNIINNINSNNKLEKLTTEININKIKEYIEINFEKQITSNNCEEYINLPEGNNSDYLKLIAKEAFIEDMISISKKSFEKKVMDFKTIIKTVRVTTNELFKLKYYREKMANNLK